MLLDVLLHNFLALSRELRAVSEKKITLSSILNAHGLKLKAIIPQK
jgi:hypothetical protein